MISILPDFNINRLWLLVFLCCFFSCTKREYRKQVQPIYAAQVAIDSAMYDVGKLMRDSSRTISHTFKLVNRGDSIVYFTEIRTGCRCMSYSLDKRTIAPRDSLFLKITYSYSDRNIGYFNKIVYILLNNGHLYSLVGLSGEIK